MRTHRSIGVGLGSSLLLALASVTSSPARGDEPPAAPPPAAPATAPAATPAATSAPVDATPAATGDAGTVATVSKDGNRSLLHPDRPGLVLVGVRAGAVFPSVFNKLDTNFLVDVEVGVQLPFLGRRLGLFVDASYTQPTSEGTRSDPRVPTNAGSESYTLTVRDLGFSVGAQWIQPLPKSLLLYGGVAYKLHLTQSQIDQKAGTTDLGTNTEQDTRHGVVVHLGLGLRLGPGALVVEAHYEYTPVDHLITGDDNTAHLSAQLGYTIFL